MKIAGFCHVCRVLASALQCSTDSCLLPTSLDLIHLYVDTLDIPFASHPLLSLPSSLLHQNLSALHSRPSSLGRKLQESSEARCVGQLDCNTFLSNAKDGLVE